MPTLTAVAFVGALALWVLAAHQSRHLRARRCPRIRATGAYPAGDAIAFVTRAASGENPAVQVMLSSQGTTRELFRYSGKDLLLLHGWAAGGLELVATTQPLAKPADLAQVNAKLWRLHVHAGRMTDTGTVLPVTEGFEDAISPDGRRAACSPIGNPIREVMWLAQGFLQPKETP